MRTSTKSLLLAEFTALMFGVPLAMVFVLPVKLVLPLLWALALLCWWTLPKDMHGNRLSWRWDALNAGNLRPMLARFALCAMMMLALTALWQPALLFGFVRAAPAFWALVMFAYPLLSVIAQEVLFRSYFFSRYRALLGRERMVVLASALAFGFAHILFQNWVAPLLCAIGGWIFARTYARSGSLALVVVEHALYGDFIFTVGLGKYFYHGAVGH